MQRAIFTVATSIVLPVTAAMAQPGDEVIDPSRLILDSVGQAGTPYSPRAGAVVYAIGTPAQSGGVFAGSATNVYDDVTFAGAPGPITLRSIATGFVLPAVFPVVNPPRYLRVTFFPDHTPAAPATAPPFAGMPVVWIIALPETCDVGGDCPHGTTFSGPPVTLDTTNVFTSAEDRTCGVLLEPFADRALTVRSTEYQVVRRAAFVHPLVGLSDTFSWYQNAAVPMANSARSGGGPFNPVFSTTPPTNTGGNCRATYMSLIEAARCDPDFNADGDPGTDADIEAFFACLAGNCCPSCASADFNLDGDSGTDADIESFFRSLAGQGC